MDYTQLLMMLPALLSMFQQSGGGSSGGGGSAGIDPSSLMDMLGSINPGSMPSSSMGSGGGGNPLMSLLGGGMGGMGGSGGNPLMSLLSMFGGSSAGKQGGVSGGLEGALGGGMSGAEMGMMAGPWGALAGGILGALMGGLSGGGVLGGGVPREQKTLGVEQGLSSSNDPISKMLANYVQTQILGKGDVLSSPGGDNFGKMSQILEWLSGNSLPGLSDKGGSSTATIGGVSGIPVPRDISRLQAMLGQSPDLSSGEIAAFLPQIESMVAGGGHLKALGGQIDALINSVSGQRKAGLGGGNTSGGGNPFAALLAGGGGGGGGVSSSLMDQIQKLMSRGGMSSGTGNLVGATG